MRARPNSHYARRNPFGAAFDNGGQVQSNVGAGGPGPMPPASGGWTGTSQGYGGSGKGGGYGMGKGMGMPWGYGAQQASNPTNYGPSFQNQFNVPWGYFGGQQPYNPLLYAGFASMLPQPWRYSGPSLPLFQSQNTFTPAAPAPAPTPQPSGGGDGGFRVLPNFDQNGQIISIPNGVTWNPNYQGSGQGEWINTATGLNSWGSTPPPGFGNPSAGTPLNQYTGPGPWGGGGGGGGQNTTGPFSMAGAAAPSTLNPWEGVGGFHAARGGAIKQESMGGNMEVELPFSRAGNTWKEEIEFRRKLNDERPWPRSDKPLLKPEWVPSDVPTEHEAPDGGWMKLQL